ncbi:TetR/AcrR family transcriptional regulator [Streptomyces sp. MP131-18]|uniref:TetR/AcrR family transcriptional regulator n=1 Tax=Streptomyces sp. MP131-18 TaxID=1857892 RepID=UPI00097C894D|nr:TetR/AcrR family transcriptional regulator [Streptomyces sp. MP131-18]
MSVAPLRGGQARMDELLTTTLDVLKETGYERLTIDEVVSRVHASKATVYRRWPSKSALVVAAFVHAVSHLPAEYDTGSLRGDLLAGMDDLLNEMERLADVMAGLIDEKRRNEELATALREGFLDARKQVAAGAFARARERGEIAPDADVEVLWQIAPAVVMFRWLMMGESVPREEGHRLVDEVVLPLARAGRRVSAPATPPPPPPRRRHAPPSS